MDICIFEIYNLLNQTTFTAREGVFDISVYPMSKEFDMKIGLASDWLWLTHLQCQTPLGMPSPPYIYWCINEITRGAPCKVEKLMKMVNLA